MENILPELLTRRIEGKSRVVVQTPEITTKNLYFHVRESMDQGELTGTIYIDLSKAFDTINHGAIIAKLPRFGIVGTPQEWFTNYLFGRSQRVAFGDVLSDAQPINWGVPQGSILGPLLLLLHFNDSASTLTHCKIVKFADDTVLFVSHKSVTVIEKLLNEDLNVFCSWLETNELIINLKKGKTEYMLFGTSKRLKQVNDPPMHISYQSVPINYVESYKYLAWHYNK